MATNIRNYYIFTAATSMKLILILLSFLISQGVEIKAGSIGRIVGGKEAAVGQFPYVAVIFSEKQDGRYFYAGALISDKHVLTAGQVVHEAVKFVVHLGSNRLNANDTNRIVATTGDYHIHPDYNPRTLENDVGIIVFRIPIMENTYVKPIKFNSPSDIPPDTPVLAMGWGSTTDTVAQQSEYLYYTQVATMANRECREVYGSQIKDHMVCVAGNSIEGICHGDMGGPLVHVVGIEHKVVGVASFVSGQGCESLHPSGFTRVFQYEKWISEVTDIKL